MSTATSTLASNASSGVANRTASINMMVDLMDSFWKELSGNKAQQAA